MRSANKLFVKRFWILCLPILLGSCMSVVDDNKLTVTNLASGAIIFHFRGEEIKILASGGVLRYKDVPRGKYSYSTTYEVPAYAKEAKPDEDLAGTFQFFGETSVTLVYSSVTTSDSVYNIHAVSSSSEDLSAGTLNSP